MLPFPFYKLKWNVSSRYSCSMLKKATGVGDTTAADADADAQRRRVHTHNAKHTILQNAQTYDKRRANENGAESVWIFEYFPVSIC